VDWKEQPIPGGISTWGISTLLMPLFLFVIALINGVLNSVAGGGGLIIFPVLLITGMSPVAANATGTVASLLGLIAGVKAYQTDLQSVTRLCVLFSGVSFAGATIGALLVLWIPNETIKPLIPYLLLMATLLFTFSDLLLSRLPTVFPKANPFSASFLRKLALILFPVAIYGGFYGLGISFLLLTVLRMLGLEGIHQINGMKVLLMSCNTLAATIAFIPVGVIAWNYALLVMLGTTIGGYLGAHHAHRLDLKLIKYFIIATGIAMTSYFFIYT